MARKTKKSEDAKATKKTAKKRATKKTTAKAKSSTKSTGKSTGKAKTATRKKASRKAAAATTKSKKVTGKGNGAMSEPVIMVNHDQIAAKAYEIWQTKGRPLGQDEQNWREAEAALKQEATA